MKISVKTKILFTIITLTVVSLSLYGYFTFKTYKEDKLAFVYDYLAQETQSKAIYFTTTRDNYDHLLGLLISQVGPDSKSLPEKTSFYLQKNSSVTGIYYHNPFHMPLQELELYQNSEHQPVTWINLKRAPPGLSLINGKVGSFVLKKPLSDKDAFSAIVFRSIELSDFLSSNKDRKSFILTSHGFISKTENPLTIKQLDDLKKKLTEVKGAFGLFEIDLSGIKYFAAFSKLDTSESKLISLIDANKIMVVQQTLMNQIMAFLSLIISACLIVGTLSARWLTWHLDELTYAANEMGAENFDIKVEFHSKDEFGTLGTTFNNMNFKIKSLLEELRVYNSKLQDLVEERTKELHDLTKIQKAMLNSLGQGFVIMDKEQKVLPVYSKIAQEMFEVVPDQVTPVEILGVNDENKGTYTELFEMAFAEALPFEDIASLSPDSRTNSRSQKISLNYAPIRNEETKSLEYVLIIGTDKTAEIESIEKFNKEWSFSQMILKLAGNRQAFNKMVSESVSMIDQCIHEIENPKASSLTNIFRYIHTIKGNFSFFNMVDVTSKAHILESMLEKNIHLKELDPALALSILEQVLGIQVSIECYIEKFDNILQLKEYKTHRLISNDKIQSFYKTLTSTENNLSIKFRNTFFTEKVASYFQVYPSLIQELGTKLNKNVKFAIEGGNLDLPEGPWNQLFGQFIHVVRNAIDHGIELPEERIKNGKNPCGLIEFKFKITTQLDKDFLEVTLKDDGKGIDWKKLATKDPNIMTEEDALNKIMTGGVSAKDEVSDNSGRGIGVSSLHSVVNNLNGSLMIKNNYPFGTVFLVTVPLNTQSKKLKEVA